jgi:hypothetical protein
VLAGIVAGQTIRATRDGVTPCAPIFRGPTRFR